MLLDLIIIHTVFATANMALALLSILLIRKIKKGSRKTMIYFQLNPEDTALDFEILFTAVAIMLPFFFVFLIGGVIESSLLLDVHRIAGFVAYLFLITVFYRWQKRFR